MADGVEFELEGLEEVMGKLKELPIDMRKKGGRFALRKAAQVVRDAARDNAKTIDDPNSDADISKNIVERWAGRYFSRSGGDMMFRVGVMGGAGGRAKATALAGLPGGDTRHWRQLEFGNQNHPAQPFMRRAMTENINKATSTFISEYGKALDRALKRAKKVT
jgi:HK97 gp10 family phage protein